MKKAHSLRVLCQGQGQGQGLLPRARKKGLVPMGNKGLVKDVKRQDGVNQDIDALASRYTNVTRPRIMHRTLYQCSDTDDLNPAKKYTG